MLTQKMNYSAVTQRKFHLAFHCHSFLPCYCYPFDTGVSVYFFFPVSCGRLVPMPTLAVTSPISGDSKQKLEWEQLVVPRGGLSQQLQSSSAGYVSSTQHITAGAVQLTEWGNTLLHLMCLKQSCSKWLLPISQLVLCRSKGMLNSNETSKRGHFSVFP